MHRKNIYLSETEQVALDARAAAEGRSRSDLVCALIDRELNLEEDGCQDVLLYELAEEFG